MFPLHRSNELCFQISPNPNKRDTIISSEDLILGHASLDQDHKKHNIIIKSRRRNSLPTSTTTTSNNNNNNNNNHPQNSTTIDNKNKKMLKHRDIERQRRQEMATLHASLRSLLPLELIKGKRSISDHINETARYIKQLQIKIKELSAKRDELNKYLLSDSSTTSATDHGGTSSGSTAGSIITTGSPKRRRLFTVQPSCSGVEIAISTSGFINQEGIPLSGVLELLLEQGLNIVSCVSTKVNGRLLHTIQSEASNNIESINLSELEQKLNQVIISSSS